jgi:hypothetical protein
MGGGERGRGPEARSVLLANFDVPCLGMEGGI